MLTRSMRLSELFSVDDLIVHFEPTDKWDAIRQLVRHLVRRGRLTAQSEAAIVDAVLARERSMSTGMEHGIAIPHAAVDGIETVVACMGVVSSPSGLAFDSIDGRPTRVIVLLIIPRAQKLLHIRTLADIARVLGRDSVREQLIAARDGQEAWSALVEGDAARR
jgi:mannitol/fructose-specific phosphotransferase system IIA component (Ntr-type)